MSNISSSKTSSAGKESRNSKGQASRETILLAAAKLATLKGLSGLLLADLASEVGMSKSDHHALGEIAVQADVDQAVFELETMLLAANFLFVMTNDSMHLTKGRRGIENVLALTVC